MVRSVDDRNFHVDERIASKNARSKSFFDPFDTRGDVFFWNDAADDFVDNFVAFTCLIRLDFEADVRILTAAARLLDVFGFDLAGAVIVSL